MICLQSGGAIEGKIVELIGEYGVLRVEQLQRYFSIEDAQMEKIIRKLVKKGRLVSDKEHLNRKRMTKGWHSASGLYLI